jgi:hypothetical protein
LEIDSSSVAVKLTVTGCPKVPGLGVTPVIVTTGARSFTVSVVDAEPVRPAASVAFTVMVKIF